ncbi:MAG: rcc01693 family protein [Hyphomicrobiaceae bacterium]
MIAVAGEAPAPPRPFPWAEVMALGFGLLRLPPDVFWKMTPREFALAAEAVRGRRTVPMQRGELEGLMQAFPD